MSVGWRSTTLSLASRHCPRALDFYEAGTPYDRAQFATGTAAHAILEELGKASVAAGGPLLGEEAEAVAQRVCEELIARGRDFEGEPEPPLPSDRVWAGRDLALAYQAEMPLSHGYRYEEGLAVNRDWMPCPYDAGAWLRCRIDAVGTRSPDWWEDDAGGGPILEVADYKSSWAADADELKTLQRKIQAVLAWDRWGEGHSTLRLVVVNFRMRREYDLTVEPNEPEGRAVLERWRSDIESEIRAREAQVGEDGARPATPGACCLGCPYLMACEAAQGALVALYGDATAEDLAMRYAVAKAVLDRLEEPLRVASAEAPVRIPGGQIGTLAREQRVLKKGAEQVLAEAWNRHGQVETVEMAKARVPGLLLALGIGVKQAESLLSHLYRGSDEQMDRRRRLLAEVLTTRPRREFGVHREVA